jgi:hypothetical protein
MDLLTKASYIEEIKEALQKRYNSLKSRIKKDGNPSDDTKNKVVKYAREMTEHANQHYYGAKHLIEHAAKTDRVAKQIASNIKSIRSYQEKINNLCGYGNRQ